MLVRVGEEMGFLRIRGSKRALGDLASSDDDFQKPHLDVVTSEPWAAAAISRTAQLCHTIWNSGDAFSKVMFRFARIMSSTAIMSSECCSGRDGVSVFPAAIVRATSAAS